MGATARDKLVLLEFSCLISSPASSGEFEFRCRTFRASNSLYFPLRAASIILFLILERVCKGLLTPARVLHGAHQVSSIQRYRHCTITDLSTMFCNSRIFRAMLRLAQLQRIVVDLQMCLPLFPLAFYEVLHQHRNVLLPWQRVPHGKTFTVKQSDRTLPRQWLPVSQVVAAMTRTSV